MSAARQLAGARRAPASTHRPRTPPRSAPAPEAAAPGLDSPHGFGAVSIGPPQPASPLGVAAVNEPPVAAPTLVAAPVLQAAPEPEPAAAGEERALADAAPPLPQPPSGERVPLPHAEALRDRFVTLPPVEVFAGPAASRTLDALGADAATVDGRILVHDADAPLEVITHEVVHAEQQRRTPDSPGEDSVLPRTASAEAEADAIAARLPTDAPEPVAAPAAPTSVALDRSEPASDDPNAAFRERRDRARSARAPRSGAAERGAPAAAEAPAPAVARDGAAPPLPVAEAGVPTLLDEMAALPAVEEASSELPVAEPLAAADVQGSFEEFSTRTPTDKALLSSSLGETLQAKANDEQAAFTEATPDFHATLSGEELEPLPEGVQGPTSSDVVLEQGTPPPPPEPDIAPTVDPGEYAANDGVEAFFRRLFGGGGEADRANQVAESLDQVRTTDPDVVAEPGPAPTVVLEGEIDPARVEAQEAEGRAQAEAGRAEAAQAVIDGRGPGVVQPVLLEETYEVPETAAPGLASIEPAAGVDTYLQADLPANVRSAVDEQQGPAMEASLGEAQSQVRTATSERDEDRSTALAEAEEQNRIAVEDAQRSQNQEVESRRDEIQAARVDTLQKQQDAVDDVSSQVETERTETLSEVDERVTADEARIESEYDSAEVKAQDEIDKGERDAEEERREAEREAEDRSWWERAIDWVADALSALADAINVIFDFVRDAVGAILDAVKDLAHAIIDAVADFIKSAIRLFGELLKGLVDGLIGQIFPELAAELNAAIDSAVQSATEFVDSVAEGLKSLVDALVDTLFAAFNAILSAYQLAINAGLALATAVITGDWSAALRIIIEGVLQVAGIDKEAFYAFVGRAEETFQIIVDDPGAFVGNLIDAFLQGVGQLKTNFFDWLQRGVIEWLTGPLPDIQMPATWDFWGVLDLVRQVLGLTYERMREKAVRVLGETAVQVIEFVTSYIQTLIQEGWRGLFERIQADLANLATQLLSSIGSMIAESVVTAAITRLATMFNPVGAIVNLVLTAWNFYTFLRDQIQRIAQLVRNVVDAIGDIARGIIQPAADRVEQTLGGFIPLAIDLLARLLGLGNIPESVRGVIEDVRGMVDGAIEALIARIRALFSGGGAEGAAVAAEDGASEATGLGAHEHFGVGAEQHELWVSISGQSATVMMSSETPSPLMDKLAGYRRRAANLREAPDQATQQQGQAAGAAVERAAALVPQLDRSAESAVADSDVSASEVQAVDQARDQIVAELRIVIQNLGVIDDPGSDARFEQFYRSSPYKPETQEPPRFTQADGTPVLVTSPRVFTKPEYASWIQRSISGTSESDAQQFAETDIGGRDRRRRGIAKAGNDKYLLVQAGSGNVDLTEVQAGLDPRIGAVTSGTIVAFMHSVAQGGHQISHAELTSLWQVPQNRDHLKDRFRGAHTGQHEWIPTNYIPNVVTAAANAGDAERTARIIDLHHLLRTPTWKLVFKPIWRTRRTVDGVESFVLNGHTGAAYLEDDTPLTTFQETFHDDLRAVFDSTHKDVDPIVDGLKAGAERWIWRNEPVNPNAYHTMKFGTGGGREDLAARVSRQPTLYQEVLQDLERVRAQSKT